MRCPQCAGAQSKVVDKRDIDDSGIIRRRRECLSCGKRYTTYEKIDMTDLLVVKKSGRREPFDAEKIKKGIMRACEKLPINIHEIDRMVDEVEDNIRKQQISEMPSDVIGDEVIKVLKKVDKVACIRFASVYKSFQDIYAFEQEVHNLLQDAQS